MNRTFEQARDDILEHVERLGVESISLADVVGRVLAIEIKAPWGLPLWDNSAVCGLLVMGAIWCHVS